MKNILMPVVFGAVLIGSLSTAIALDQSLELKAKNAIDTSASNNNLVSTESGTLSIDSTPKGSRILIKGETKGHTPVTLDLKAGEYEVVLEHPEYRPWHFTITILSSKQVEIFAALEKVDNKAQDAEKSDLKSKGPVISSSKVSGKEIHIEKYKAGQVWVEPVTGMEFIWVPRGCFDMGCGNWTGDCDDDESPVHEVCVDGFWMGKSEVTQGPWNNLMEDNPSEFQKGDNYPVDRVSWNEAKAFAESLADANKGAYTFRLPTEAEWEYACRSGGKPEKYAGGGTVDEVAWYANNSQDTTHPAEKKKANGLGLYDMCGNVYEWCEDKYSNKAYETHERNNPMYTGSESRRVGRGGCWRYVALDVRCSFRSFSSPGLRFHHLGFRLVRTK